MLKFLLIVALVVYVVYKVGSLFFRAGAASQQFRNPNGRPFGAKENPANSKRAGSSAKGGEYVDYEEIK